MITTTDIGSLSAGVRLEGHRAQGPGATRGQQQPSSLQNKPPPSLATPGEKKRPRGESLRRERAGGC
ncbi:hypothetical protein CesoFtcFv8_011268 [Champsocephalus esox]|uniref:Uncharacterized protein n=1 Tax=Champsocephalus esox TaxID=159716 RepID=A0AAN8GX12_9TELE|nr:hypothetical protein CesoFtcFv8_011268 [Champsocephalus esox]